MNTVKYWYMLHFFTEYGVWNKVLRLCGTSSVTCGYVIHFMIGQLLGVKFVKNKELVSGK